MTENLRELLLDIIKYTTGTGIVDAIKIENEEENGSMVTRVNAMDDNKSVIIKGKLNEPEPRFVGSVGMSRLSILKGFAELASHKTDNATVEIKTAERQGNIVSEEIVFTDEKGTSSVFRLMSGDIIPNAKFLGAKWTVEFTPDKSTLAEFAQKVNILSSLEQVFWPSFEDGVLTFHIGEKGSTHYTNCIMTKDGGQGKLSANNKMFWPNSLVLNILKLDSDNTSTFKISEDGAAMIEIKSKNAVWQYILPAKMKR